MNEIAIENQVKNIISELVKTRQKKKLSQRRLEKMTGIQQAIISKIETGVEMPRLDTLLKLSFSLEKTVTLTSLNVDLPPTSTID